MTETPSESRAEQNTTPREALKRLFLTLFLRGRSSRGVDMNEKAPTVLSKLWLSLVIYGLLGLTTLLLLRQSVIVLSIYQHSMTLAMVGMIIASSSGELLFNKAEDDILLHRPIEPSVLLWTKMLTLMKVSWWLSMAINLSGLVVGVFASNNNGAFPLAHFISTSLVTFFCVGAVVSVYQVVLRFFGRERLESLMTTVQVVLSIGVVMAGQIVPRLLDTIDDKINVDLTAWWVYLLPPAWFAGIDDAIAGTGSSVSFTLAAIAFCSTGFLMWLGFVKLAHAYESGLQALGESRATVAREGKKRWFTILVGMPPLSLWLRNSISRAAFLLVAAYMARDRETKLRIYPGLAPMLLLPLAPLLTSLIRHPKGMANGEILVFCTAYLSMIPLSAIPLLNFSQQWQACDIFHVAPVAGPSEILHGARRAVLVILVIPAVIALLALAALLGTPFERFDYMLPGLVPIPLFAVFAQTNSSVIPFSIATSSTDSSQMGCLRMIVVMFVAGVIGAAAIYARSIGLLWLLVLIEIAIAIPLYMKLRGRVSAVPWGALE